MRGKGEGSVYKRADGYWVGSVEAGRYPNGRRRRARVVRKRKADVLDALDDLRRSISDGIIPDRTRSVATYLEFWLDDVVEGTVSDGTLREYGKRVARITPVIGHVKLGKLTTAHVQAFANDLAKKYPRSTNTQSSTLGSLRQALRWAVGADLITKNPAEFVSGPRTATAKIDDTLTSDEADAIIEAAKGDELEAVIWLALKYGLRIGELLDLRWPDIDFEAGELTVRKSKSEAGVRSLPIIPEAAKVLRAHRKRTTVRSIDGYVFAAPAGGKLNPQRVREHWNAILESAGIEHRCRSCGTDGECSSAVRRFHVARHTAATVLLESGVQLEVVSADPRPRQHRHHRGRAKIRSDLKRQGLSAI